MERPLPSLSSPSVAPAADSASAEAVARLVWGHLSGMSALKKAGLFAALKDYRQLLGGANLPPSEALPPRAVQEIRQWRRRPQLAYAAVRRDLDWLQQPNHHALLPGDAAWPEGLSRLAAPPLPLYADGDIGALATPLLAIVGSRKPSPAGRETAYRLAAELAHLGFGIVSGLASGIDTAAHKGALDNGGVTLAVTATGPDQTYPQENIALAGRIAAKGMLLTEYALGQRVHRHHFPARNRILAALAKGVVVIEAGAKSGALITAHIACELGTEVMAVPGGVQGGAYAGCHKLIRDGAALVENTLQVMECLSCLPGTATDLSRLATSPGDRCPAGLSEEERAVWQILSLTPMPADILSVELQWPITQVGAVLTEMEIAGAVYREAGGYIRAG